MLIFLSLKRFGTHNTAPVKRSPYNIANCGMAVDQRMVGRCLVAVRLRIARKNSFLAASSVGNTVRVLITLPIARFKSSIDRVDELAHLRREPEERDHLCPGSCHVYATAG